MKIKNKILITFGIIFVLMLLSIYSVNASKYDITDICNDLSELEVYATEYKELFPEYDESETELILDYIRNDVYDNSLEYDYPKNLEFSSYIDEINKDFNYLKYIEIVKTPIGNINFALLVSSINCMNNDEDIHWGFNYLICQQLLENSFNDSDLEKLIKINKSNYNDSEINTIMDSFNIYKDLYQKSFSKNLKDYYTKYTVAKRLNTFTNENLEIYNVTKQNLRDTIYKSFINSKKVAKALENSEITMFSNELEIMASSYAISDYIYENHPSAVKEVVIPKAILSNEILVNIPDDLYVDTSIELDIKIIPENATNKRYKISANNDNLLIENNRITAMKIGKTKVLLETEDGAIKNTFNIEIIKDNITLNSKSNSYSLKVGDNQKLDFSIEGTKDIVIFKSLDESIISVDNSGTIKALKPGDTKIVASLKNSTNITFSWDINISDVEVFYSIENKTNKENYDAIILNKKEKYKLKIKESSDNSFKGILFKSDSPKIADINKHGEIEALNSGEATISLIRESDSKVLDTCNILILYDVEEVKVIDKDIQIDLFTTNSFKLDFEIYPKDVNLETIQYNFYDTVENVLVLDETIKYDTLLQSIIASKEGNFRLDFYNQETSKIVGSCIIKVYDSNILKNDTNNTNDKNDINEKIKQKKGLFYYFILISIIVVAFLCVSLLILSVVYIVQKNKEKEEDKEKEVDIELIKEIKNKQEERIENIDEYIKEFKVDISDYLDDKNK